MCADKHFFFKHDWKCVKLTFLFHHGFELQILTFSSKKTSVLFLFQSQTKIQILSTNWFSLNGLFDNLVSWNKSAWKYTWIRHYKFIKPQKKSCLFIARWLGGNALAHARLGCSVGTVIPFVASLIQQWVCRRIHKMISQHRYFLD